MNIEFINYLNFEMTQTLQDCLLISDDSCEQNDQLKEFVKLAVSGRHKKIHCAFVEHNLFHQSLWSRAIDLKTTHNILFSSPRHRQQIDLLGRQSNNVNFRRECYTNAVAETHGQFLNDLDTRTIEHLIFFSNIVCRGQATFYLPSSQTRNTEINNEREKTAYSHFFY